MSPEQIENERRNGRIAGTLGVIGIVLFMAVGVSGLAADYNQADEITDQLRIFDSLRSEVLVQAIVQSLALLLFIAPLLALFNAARDRSEVVRPGLIGLMIAGPLFFAGSFIAGYFVVDSAAAAFVDPSSGIDTDSVDDAEDLVAAQGAYDIRGGLGFAGILGLVFAIVYTSLQAMRAGLLTRFWGTLGMALGVGLMFVGLPAMLAYFLAISLQVAGWWPGGRTPAWEAGKAVPWPKPGERPVRTEPEEELARPEDFGGSASEVEAETETEPIRPGRRDNKRKRKRKARG